MTGVDGMIVSGYRRAMSIANRIPGTVVIVRCDRRRPRDRGDYLIAATPITDDAHYWLPLHVKMRLMFGRYRLAGIG